MCHLPKDSMHATRTHLTFILLPNPSYISEPSNICPKDVMYIINNDWWGYLYKQEILLKDNSSKGSGFINESYRIYSVVLHMDALISENVYNL